MIHSFWWLLLLFLTALSVHGYWLRRFRQISLRLGWRDREIENLKQEHQSALELEQAHQGTLLDNMVEGGVLLDESGKIRLVNLSFRRFFKVPGKVTGKTLLEAVRMPELDQVVQQALKQGKVENHDLVVLRESQRFLRVNAAGLYGQNRRLTGALLIFHDLTQIHQLENTRKDFVANVSHELRTPLSLIKGAVETLEDGAMKDPVASVRFLKMISRNVDRLTFLIEDLLTLSHLESGQIVVNCQKISLISVVERVLEDLRHKSLEKEMTLENQVEDKWIVWGDGDRLQQVLFNLVDNAIKYGRKGGSVKVLAREQNRWKVIVTVQDDGPGIPVEALPRVFERFFRVDRARSREQGGTGLGLAIVKHIVQAHGGEVWVESELGKGAAFHLTLKSRMGRPLDSSQPDPAPTGD